MRDRWQALLSDSRDSGDNPVSTTAEIDRFRSSFEADYDRVIYSTPFRRLARKTQVHPLALNDHVRTRLTHSLEVACVGRGLARKLANFLADKGHLPSNRSEGDLVWITMAACAAHDIGNPPFGHAGEFAIREWIRTHSDEVFSESVSLGIRADLECFEGNAQGFRIAARQDNAKTGYLRLTYATLGAMVKYPWHSEDPRVEEKKKYNVFSSERALFDKMTHTLGLYARGTAVRHPISFLTEAADDICYRILDLEDAVEIGILEESRVGEVYDSALDKSRNEPLHVKRGKVIRRLMDGVWDVFALDYESIMSGERVDDLKKGLHPTLSHAVQQITQLYGTIFAERSKVASELGAYKALGRILKALCTACQILCKHRNYEKAGFLAQRCLELAWGRAYAILHQSRSYEWWLHQIMDYVAGLTDNYARQLSREIEGT